MGVDEGSSIDVDMILEDCPITNNMSVQRILVS